MRPGAVLHRRTAAAMLAPDMRRWLILAAVALAAMACSYEERAAAARSWESRDQERGRECQRQGGQWVAGTCRFGGGM